MAYLFVTENGIAKPNTETLLISPFKEIWGRDPSVDKDIAIKEFTFIEFMSSKKKANPYAGYADDARYAKLKGELFSEDWEMDTLIEAGLVKIKNFQEEGSVTYKYYTSAVTAAEKMIKFFQDFSFSTLGPRGLPLYKPRDITSALNDTNKVLQNLNTMKEKVEQELFEQTKNRGNKEINPFEM